MWFKVIKAFGTHLEGDTIELKDDSQYQLIVDKGLIEETEAPIKDEVSEIDPNLSYSTDSLLIDSKNVTKEDFEKTLNDFNQSKQEFDKQKSDFEIEVSNFNSEKEKFESDKVDFENAKSEFDKQVSDFNESKSNDANNTIIDEKPKGKPGPKPKE